MNEYEIKSELMKNILPFWKGLIDNRYGGFYGCMDFDLNVNTKADKGVILHSRILWFFSKVYTLMGDMDSLSYASHAYYFIKTYCLDKEEGGVYWSLTYKGDVSDSKKFTYNQAFAIYALLSYYEATKDEEALLISYSIYDLIEKKCKDVRGYLEAFDRTFHSIENDRICGNGLIVCRSAGTVLHILEAYTELYRIGKLEKVKSSIKYIMDQLENEIFNYDKSYLESYFDIDMKPVSNLDSFGHDIEASWLIEYGCEVINDDYYSLKMRRITEALRRHVLAEGFDGTAVNNDCMNGSVDSTRIWWVQSEAITGFMNGYQSDLERKEYLEAADSIWEFIKTSMIDRRPGSEWINEVDINGKPIIGRDIAGPWKCPYHNYRMCL
jgi:mannobiose 2-epimerase